MPLPPGYKSKPGEQIRIKGKLKDTEGEDCLCLAISPDNISYLKDPKRPVIGIDLRDLGYVGGPRKLFLLYGKDDEDARRMMPKLIERIDIITLRTKQ